MPIDITGVSFIYNRGTSLEKTALDNINLSIADGEFVLIGGPAGSGKSTLTKHFNGILTPHSGSVSVDGINTRKRKVTHKAGLLMQYPQKQLFGKTVFEDVSFGLLNSGLNQNEINVRVNEALKMAGLDESLSCESPFSLSGGQMRLVALAGILAMRPGYLILDEPLSGLDPQNCSSLLQVLKNLRCRGISVIVVSHQFSEFLPLAEKIVYMEKGRIAFAGTPAGYLRSFSPGLPDITLLMRELKNAGLDVSDSVFSVDDAFEQISGSLMERRFKTDE